MEPRDSGGGAGAVGGRLPRPGHAHAFWLLAGAPACSALLNGKTCECVLVPVDSDFSWLLGPQASAPQASCKHALVMGQKRAHFFHNCLAQIFQCALSRTYLPLLKMFYHQGQPKTLVNLSFV